jgi:hypothetical protein
MRALALLALLACAFATRSARAEVLQAPIAGEPIPIGEGRVACAAPAGGWTIEAAGRAVRPPASQDAIGQSVDLSVAKTAADCLHSTSSLTLVTTDRWPVFDPSSVVFAVDDGRLDAKGTKLRGVSVVWKSGPTSGVDVCRDPKRDGGAVSCTWAVGRDASVDPTVTRFSWLPNGAQTGADAVLFDAQGRRAKENAFTLVPARVVMRQLFAADAAVDLASGAGEIPLVHPEAVSSADCGALQCEMSNGQLMVRGASRLVSVLEVKLRLRPHVFFLKNDAPDSQPSAKLPVLHCPMSIISGATIRSNDDAKVVVKLEGACARDVSSLRFETDHSPLKVLQTVNDQNATYVLLQVGSVVDDSVAITAFRGQTDAIALAVAHAPTRPAPAVRATLELPGFPNLNFIPNNRPAVVHASRTADQQHFALLPIDGVYSVGQDADKTTIEGDVNAAGMTSLQFGVRMEGLPAGLDQADLAVISDPLQRSIHEANIPAPLGQFAQSPRPLIELLCGGGPIPLTRIEVGVTAHLPFSLRDTCRIVFHRERLSPEYGTQKLNFEIDVLRTDGSARGDAHVSEVITFRAGSEPRYAWINGIVDPFDRVVVRVSHEADEAHYIGASEIKTGAAAAKWSAVLGSGLFRLYGTTTIPTGLYRLSDRAHSGVLSLNFGVISRLTWLTSEGHEGFLGAEGGILVLGLANAVNQNGSLTTQVGGVVGLGVGVPIANRGSAAQASIDLHAWFETDITGGNSSGRYAFIFGPSISIGNVGTNL